MIYVFWGKKSFYVKKKLYEYISALLVIKHQTNSLPSPTKTAYFLQFLWAGELSPSAGWRFVSKTGSSAWGGARGEASACPHVHTRQAVLVLTCLNK